MTMASKKVTKPAHSGDLSGEARRAKPDDGSLTCQGAANGEAGSSPSAPDYSKQIVLFFACPKKMAP